MTLNRKLVLRLRLPTKLLLFSSVALNILGAESAKQSPAKSLSVPPDYRKEAIRVILEEANAIAADLHLKEKLPITEADLVESFVCPPRFRVPLGIGNITTGNYNYSVAGGSKLTFLTKVGLADDYSKLEQEYKWPLSQIDTNSAYQLSTQWLAAIPVDVAKLNRECQLFIRPYVPGGTAQHFVPVYWVFWSRSGKTMATVELLLPTKSLRQMGINRPEYVLRKPVDVKNLDKILASTNMVEKPNAR